MTDNDLSKRIEIYEKTLQTYETQINELEKSLAINQDRLKVIEQELQEQFGTTDIQEIENRINRELEKVVQLEQQLQQLMNEYNSKYGQKSEQ